VVLNTAGFSAGIFAGFYILQLRKWHSAIHITSPLPSITNNTAVAVPSYKWIPLFPAMKLQKISALMLTAMKIQLSSGKEATVYML
jgi:hypothetical protein